MTKTTKDLKARDLVDGIITSIQYDHRTANVEHLADGRVRLDIVAPWGTMGTITFPDGDGILTVEVAS